MDAADRCGVRRSAEGRACSTPSSRTTSSRLRRPVPSTSRSSRRLGLTSAMVVPLAGLDGVIGCAHPHPCGVRSALRRGGRRVPGGRGGPGCGGPRDRSDLRAAVGTTGGGHPRGGGRSARDPGTAPGTGSGRSPCRRTTARAAFRRAQDSGGDLYEVVRGPSSVRLLVGDVRGKGLSAVRTATVVLGEFRAAAAGPGDVAHVAREIDRRILPYLPDAEDFVTGVLVDIRARRLLRRRLLRPPRARAAVRPR